MGRQETISAAQPMRFSAAVSPSADPSISTRSAPIRRRRARRQPRASGNEAPRAMISSKISAGVRPGPPARPKAARKTRASAGPSTRPIICSPPSVASRRTRMLSPGSRSQIGSSRPVTSQKRDSVCGGRPSISPSHSARHWSPPASRHCEAPSSASAMVSRAAGRTSRTRSWTLPSSNMREGAGSTRAARLERPLTMSRASRPEVPARSARADSAVVGSSLSRRRISTISISAPEPSWTNTGSREAMVKESAPMVSTPRSKVPASTACSMLASMRLSSSANSAFCSAIGSASSRLRNFGIGGRSSLRLPSQVSLSPVASSKRPMGQCSTPPRHSAM